MTRGFRIHTTFERGQVRATIAPASGFGHAGPLDVDPDAVMKEYRDRYGQVRRRNRFMASGQVQQVTLRQWYAELAEQEQAS